MLFRSLVESVRSGRDMDARTTSAMLLRSLTEQAPMDKEFPDNVDVILQHRAVEPLVALVGAGTSQAQLFALDTLAHLCAGRPRPPPALPAPRTPGARRALRPSSGCCPPPGRRAC